MIVREISEDNINKSNKKKGIKALTPYLFLLPHLIFFAVFVVYPFFYGIYISFTEFNLMGEPSFCFLNNYTEIFTFGSKFSKDFFSGLLHTFIYTMTAVPLVVFVPLILAVLLYAIKNVKIRNFFQSILYSTSILSVSTVVLIFTWLLDRDNGLFNNLFNVDINFKGNEVLTWVAIISLTLWSGVGGNMIIFLSSISSIPKSQYEAASLDGANVFNRFFRLTLPSLRFPLTYSLITGVIGGFNVFGQPFLFGGKVGSYETVMMRVYEYAFGTSPMAGMASAMSVLLGIIILFVSIVQFRLMREK
ncbi:MAG: sugar ABC transporter permease [Clostridia bacterium]|nr:sugar ABC transporter permease [Clostridia bacterium]